MGSTIEPSLSTQMPQLQPRFWSHLHFRLFCQRTHSSKCKSFICFSASRVHRLIESTHDSKSVSSSSHSWSGASWCGVGEGSLVTSLPLSVCSEFVLLGVRGVSFCGIGIEVLFARLRGRCITRRSICRCVLLTRFSNSLVMVHASDPYSIVGVTVP